LGDISPSSCQTGAQAWWLPTGALDRFLADLLFAEAQALRPGGPWPSAAAFSPEVILGEEGLGFDSLERLAMAAALGEALFLHHGGLDDTLVVDDRLRSWRDAAAAALEQFSARICFRSSGSTGPRHRYKHNMADLGAEMGFFASQMPGRRRVVAAVACHHIYGFLFTLVLPARLGVPVTDIRGQFPSAIASALRPGDLVVGHPGFWADLCRAAPSCWPADIVGVSSGATCPDAIAEAVVSAGLSRLVQVYGASETSGIGWRDEASLPYALLPSWRQVDGGTMLQRGDAAGLEPPDRLCWHGPDRFMPEGRRDSAVQVGGTNVYPGRVREILLAHPAVADAAVRLMASHEGNRLKAFVVPRDQCAAHDALRQELDSHLELRTSVAERPRAFSFGPCLPMTAAGKPGDWPVPAV
jgi:long-chain acyl-CoA synthetase